MECSLGNLSIYLYVTGEICSIVSAYGGLEVPDVITGHEVGGYRAGKLHKNLAG
jgi:hypothetical protein